MTNNPTIDGVSLLPCPFCGCDAVLKQYRADGLEIRCTGCQSMRRQRWMGKGRGWLETKMIEKWNERAIHTAERQEPVVLLSEHKKGLDAYLEQIKGQQSTIARLEARITQLESEKEFAAATYQAARDRIAELESGRGEQIGMLLIDEYFDNREIGEVDVQLDSESCEKLARDFPGRSLPVFVGPTALPERKPVTVGLLSESNTHNQGWNACLDATAALNEVKS